MPRKRRNWEIENFGVHNTSKQTYFNFSNSLSFKQSSYSYKCYN